MALLPSYIMGGVGLISSIFGGASQRRQQNEIINRMLKIAQDNRNKQIQMAMPYYQAGQEGLEQTRAFTNEMNRKRFANNPYYDQARQTSLNEANRQIAQSSKSSAYAFSQNQGRARGEQARAGRLGIQAKNSINLNWARSTEADRMQKTQMYLNGVSQLNQMGHTGTNIMSNAYNNYAQQSMNALSMTPIDSTMSDIGGTLFGAGVQGILQHYWQQGWNNGEGDTGGDTDDGGGNNTETGNLKPSKEYGSSDFDNAVINTTEWVPYGQNAMINRFTGEIKQYNPYASPSTYPNNIFNGKGKKGYYLG